MIDCTVAENSSSCGGALMIRTYCTAEMINCSFHGNASSSTGGAVEVRSGLARLTNCVLSHNEAPAGGALEVSLGTVAMANCVLTRNASPFGGIMHNHGGGVSIENCVLWDNESPIFAEDAPTVSFSDVQGGCPGVGNIDADPCFVDADGPDADPSTWQDNDYHLSADSPCIDAGHNDAVPVDAVDLDADGDTSEPIPVDADWRLRYADRIDTPDTGQGALPIVDMGSCEYQCTGDLNGDGVIDLGDLAVMLADYDTPDGAFYPDGDLDRDGAVDLADLAALLGVYGTTCE